MKYNIIVFWLYQHVSISHCARFLALLADTRSHVTPVINIATELEKTYDHSVTFVLSTTMQQNLKSDGIFIEHIIAKSMDDTDLIEVGGKLSESAMTGDSMMKTVWNVMKAANEFCHNFSLDEELFRKFKASKFDYAIVACAPVLCYEVTAYKLGLPFICVSSYLDSVLNRVPLNPSFMPTLFSVFGDRMTFLQRLGNTLLFLPQLFLPVMPSFSNLVEIHAPEKPFLSNQKLRQSALINIIDSDFLMDYAIPIPPNVILCGGLATRAAHPLTLNVERYIDMSKDGLVVVSFGSIVKTIPTDIYNKLLVSFFNVSRLQFIFRFGNETKVIKNVLQLPWLTQNDLLSNGKTKLLITHCGKSSIFEALYHGVPMIGFPLSREQLKNSNIMTDKGYGMTMDINHFSIEELVENIERVALSEEFKAKIKQASEIFHSHPLTPSQRASYWINMVTKYGISHIRPASVDMPWYSYYMIDLLVFITTTTGMVMSSTVLICRKCYRLRNNKKSKQKIQ